LFNNFFTNETELKAPFYFIVITLIVIISATIFSIIELQPPKPLPSDAPLDQFSALRAFKHLEVLAIKPRPAGSLEHKQAQNYIVQTLSTLGLKAQLNTANVSSTRWGMPFDSATVTNIIVKIPTKNATNLETSETEKNSKAILFSCHYDSVPNSFGAADDGSGVVALLEVARALSNGSPLDNQVILLFTDAEEGGALGAKAFVENYPELNKIGLAINFDARGNHGATVLFETTDQNGYLISEFAKVVPHPVASSAFYEVAKILGLSTDFRLFREAGIPGYNFAFTEGIPYYHTPIDNIANLDKGSLQQQGEYALALARHFGDLKFNNVKKENVIFFNITNSYLISYPQKFALPLTILVLVIFILNLIIGLQYKIFELKTVLLGLIYYLAILVVISMIIGGINYLLLNSYSVFRAMRTSDSYCVIYFRLAYCFLAIASYLLLIQRLSPKISRFNFAISVSSVWLLLLTIVSIRLPGMSYIFTWPLLLFLLSNIFFTLTAKTAKNQINYIFVPLFFSALPTIFLLVPVPYLIFVSLQLSRAYLAILFVGLICGLLTYYWQLLLTRLTWYLPISIGFIALCLFSLGLVKSRFNENQPQPTSLAYYLDLSKQRAYWLSEDRILTKYSANFISNNQKESAKDLFPDDSLEVSRNDAEVVNLTGPTVKLLSDLTENNVRKLKFLISSPRNAQWLYTFVTSSPEIIRTEINNAEIKDKLISQPVINSCWGFRHINLPTTGLEWTLEVKANNQPVEFMTIDQSFELPTLATTKGKLSPDMMIARSWIANSTLVKTVHKY
jgi:hypothetical protein